MRKKEGLRTRLVNSMRMTGGYNYFIITESNEHTIYYHLLVGFAIELDDVSYEVSENVGDDHLALIICFNPVSNASNLTIAQGREVNIVAETQDGEAIGI